MVALITTCSVVVSWDPDADVCDSPDRIEGGEGEEPRIRYTYSLPTRVYSEAAYFDPCT